MFRWMLVVVVVALLVGGCRVPKIGEWKELELPSEATLPQPERKLGMEIGGTLHTLPNGLSVALLPDDGTELVEVGVRYRVGAVDDPPGKEGLAHLIEHLLFEQRPGGKGQRSLGTLLGDVAVHHNAFTTWDSTHYTAVAARDQFEELIRIESLRLSTGCREISQATFEIEREVVRNELRSRGTSPVVDALIRALYPKGHPYRRSVGGNNQSLSAITLADVCDFVRKHYDPTRVTVVITGRLSFQEAGKVVDTWLARIPRRKIPKRARIKRPPIKRGNETRTARVSKPVLLVSWPTAKRYGASGALSEMVATQLRLQLAIANRKKSFASEVSVSRFGGIYAPMLVVVAELNRTSDAIKARAAIMRAAAKVKGAWTNGNIPSLRSIEYLNLLGLVDELAGRTSPLADYYQFDETRTRFSGDLSRLRRAEASELGVLASKILQPTRAYSITLRPDPDKPTTDRDTLGTTLPSHTEQRWKRFVDPAMAKRPQPYQLGPSLLEKAKRIELRNGMRAIVLRSFYAPTLTYKLVLNGGYADVPNARAGLARAAIQLLEHKTSNFGSLYVDAAELVLGEHVFRSASNVSQFTTSLDVWGFSTLQDFGIQGLGALMRRGHYDAKRVAKTVKRWQKQLSTEEARRDRRTVRALRRAMFGADHPLALRGIMTPMSVSGITARSLEDYRRMYFTPDKATLIIVGRISHTIAKAHIPKAFAGWRGRAVGRRPIPSATPPTKSVHMALHSDRERMMSVGIGYVVGKTVDADYAARLVVTEMLRGRVSSVRTKLGAAYTVSASLNTSRALGYYSIGGVVDGKRGGEALIALRTAVTSLHSERDFARDFVLARRQAVRRLVAAAADREAVAGRLAFLARNDLPNTFYRELVAKVAALTPAKVKALIGRELAATAEVTVCVGRAATVAAAYKSAGISNVVTQK